MFNNNFTTVSVSQFGSMFAVGDLSLLNKPSVSVSGSRKIDYTSIKWLQDTLSNCGGRVIISGLALGSDAVAHRWALSHNVPTIAILPSGFNYITPKSHIKLAKKIVANGGLLLSKYEPNTYVKNSYYIARNKIIASMGDLLIVPQCNKSSGTMHTVRFAQSLHKPIVVQDANYSGNRFIIDSYNLAIPQ